MKKFILIASLLRIYTENHITQARRRRTVAYELWCRCSQRVTLEECIELEEKIDIDPSCE